MQANRAMIYVIDDDESVRHALARLLRSAGLEARTFASAEAFLKAECPIENACIVADVRLEGMNGLELQRELKRTGSPLRIVFVSAQDTEVTGAEAIRAGGADFLVKPVDEEDLLDAVRRALTPDGDGRRTRPQDDRAGVLIGPRSDSPPYARS